MGGGGNVGLVSSIGSLTVSVQTLLAESVLEGEWSLQVASVHCSRCGFVTTVTRPMEDCIRACWTVGIEVSGVPIETSGTPVAI